MANQTVLRIQAEEPGADCSVTFYDVYNRAEAKAEVQRNRFPSCH